MLGILICYKGARERGWVTVVIVMNSRGEDMLNTVLTTR